MPGVLQTDGANGAALGSDPSSDPTSDDHLPPVEEFVVVNQEVSIDINFREQSVQGESRITIYLTNPDDPPDEVALDARQCEIDTTKIQVNGKSVRATYRDPYESLDLPPSWDLTPSNFPVLKSRMRNLLPKRRRDLPVEKREQVGCNPADRSLRVALKPEPPKPANAASGAAGSDAQQPGKLKVRLSTVGLQGVSAATTNGDSKTDSDQPTDGLFEIVIPFKTTHIRDGLHFVGVEDSDTRFPHVYTRHSPEPGIAACIFPCLDDPGSRCFWKIHIKIPRTLGDALMQQLASNQSMNDAAAVAADAAANNDKSITVNSDRGRQQQQPPQNGQRQLQLTEEDKLLDMTVICSGNLVGEKADEADETKKIMTFEITDHGAAANQIGFAVGPFEHVDLYTGFRTDEVDDKLGASALKIHGYCLPGRQAEVENACVSLTMAADEFAMTYGRYPYDSFKLCFVDDMVSDTTPLLSFSLCSTRLLFPDSIVERDFDVTRKLVHSLAYQYFGSYIVPNQRCEMWLTVGIAYYMTDLFLCKLCGNNDYRFRIKTMSDRLAEEDRDRPSLHDLGTYTYLGDFEMDFMALKAPLVLFILDKRLTKAAGSASASLARVISKIIGKANTSGWGDNNNEIISSESFRRVCEKTSQYQLEAFWNQWVLGSGCPWLTIKQRFNRKRLCVEIGIHQTQETAMAKARPIHHAEFWRELVEKRHGTYTRKVQRLFTGPMTIRIHEANGTPYEHIVEIRDDAAFTGGAKFDIPYNTKYKRLKRNRRNREKAAALAANNADNNNANGANGGEGGDDAIVFSLGDKLDTPDEMAAWGLIDWTEQDEKSMDQESYEWIRIDSDFEWISKIHTNMPAWMYLSQLQQDRDIVAQQDTLLYLSRIREHAMSATILTRTLYDDRYFHGLRTLAAENLTRQVWKAADTAGGAGANGADENGSGNANGGESIVYRGLDQLMHVFRRFHCYDDATSKPNDFEDMRRYLVQCAVIDAISKVHFEDKRPRDAQRFLLDILRFNNNNQNPFSDHLYVARVIVALATSFCATNSNATQTGINASNSGKNATAAAKQKERSKMNMVLTFDDGMSDDDDDANKKDDESDDFNLGADIDRMEIDTEDQQLLEAALAEIERYRRMDEWTSSYQNAWTTAALEAKRKLMKTGVIPVDALEFVRYLQDGTIDTVQLKAFEALIDLGLMLRPVILKLLLSTMTTHTSPFMRDQLFKLFCKGLASIAFGEHTGSSGGASDEKDKKKDQAGITNGNGTNGDANTDALVKKEDKDDDSDSDDDTGGLIIEQGDAITKKHQEEHARRENIDAAVAALREAVKGNQELLSAMWDAVLSPVTGCTEKRNLMDLLEVMFDGESSLLLTVKHPTMWTATRKATPGGVIDFKKVPRPLKTAPPPVPVVLPVVSDLASATSALPTLVPAAATATPAATGGVAAASTVPATPGQRTALPGAPARKPTMPKIKLQTSRISIGGSPAPSPAAVGTPIVIKKPSVATPAPVSTPTSSSVLPSLTKKETTSDSISVQPAQRKSSVAATPAPASISAKAKSPTPANDYFGNFTSRMGKTPQPAAVAAATAAVSPAPSAVSSSSANNNNKRKRQDSHVSAADSTLGGSSRPRKMVKISVPTSYQHKLSPRASLWLETYRTPSPGMNNSNGGGGHDGDSIRAAGFVSPKKSSTPHSTSSKDRDRDNYKASSVPRGSATPGPSHKLPSSKPRGPTPQPASSSKAGSPVKRESATPDIGAVKQRKPLPGSNAPAGQAPAATPAAPPSAASTPTTEKPASSKPIFIKFKSKTSS